MDIAATKKEAKSKKTPPHRLEDLARIPDATVQLVVANNPNTPAAALEYLGGHGKFNILKAVAKNPNTPDPVLEKLSRHKQATVREAVASREKLIEPIAVRLAQDTEQTVKIALVYFWYSHKDPVWQILAKDPDPKVRGGVAGTSVISDALLETFFSDPSQDVRAAIGLNFKLEHRPDWVDRLLEDSDPVVRSTAYRYGKLKHYARMISDPDVDVRAEAAMSLRKELLESGDSEQLLSDLFAKLAQDPAPEVRMALTENWDCLPEILIQLASDPNERVRYGVVEHTETPKAAFEILAKDNSKTRFNYMGEPDPKGDTLAQLAKEALKDFEEDK